MELEDQIVKEFEDWFHDIYGGGYSLRSEWFHGEFDHAESVEKLRKSMKIWIQSAFQEGYERGLYNLLEQKQKAKELIEELRYWSQNEEMIDQYFTKHGEVCNSAADLLEEFVNEN